MFESTDALAEDIGRLLDTLRRLSEARYGCLLDRKGILFESGEGGTWALRALFEAHAGEIFDIPPRLASGGPEKDVFEGWDDEFLLAFINGRVVLALACPEAERARAEIEGSLPALADSLLRYRASYRLDERGRGLFVGAPRLDVVVVGR